MRKMATLNAFLVHPKIACIQRQIITCGARADHHHPAFFTHESRNRESAFTRVLEYNIHIHALARDLPNGLAKFAHLGEPSFIRVRIHNRQLSPSIEIFAIDNAFSAQAQHKVAFIFIRNHGNRIGASRIDQLLIFLLGLTLPDKMELLYFLVQFEHYKVLVDQHAR